MKRLATSFLTSPCDFATRLLFATTACLLFTLAMAGPALTQTCPPANIGDTCPVVATVGFETGLRDLAYLKLDKTQGATINWGDNTPHENGLIRCFDVLHPHQCHVFGIHRYLGVNNYPIIISYTPADNLFATDHATTLAAITPPGNFVILSIGDSIASGEGNPVLPQDLPVDGPKYGYGYWDDAFSDYSDSPIPADELAEWPNMNTPCHRSGWTGAALAGANITAANPNVGVTFFNFACSGATISTDPQGAGAQDAVGQLRVARGRLPRIDVLVISAGANSLYGPNSFGDGFAGLVQYCLEQQLDPLTGYHCSNNPNVSADLKNSFKTILPNEYSNLAKEINCINPDGGTPEPSCTDPQKQIPKLVLITEVMDPTHDAQGQYPILGQCPAGFDLVGQYEWQFFHDSIVDPLNHLIDSFNGPARAAGLAAPTYTVGIADAFHTHGICAGSARWVNDIGDSVNLLGPDPHNAIKRGTAHPNSAPSVAFLQAIRPISPNPPDCTPNCGHETYATAIQSAIVQEFPTATTASATAGGAAYTFGTWANKDVIVTLSATNALPESGVGAAYYAVDSANCSGGGLSASVYNCSSYSGPFTISSSGKHTVTFFSANAHGFFEPSQTVQVWVDKNPALSSVPDAMTIPQGESASYTILLGHQGWTGQTINLSCTTDAQLTGCTMLPTSVMLDATNSNASVATVVTTRTGGLPGQAALVQQNPFGPLGALRFLLAFTMAAFLVAMARALRAQRWVRVTHFAALALLFGWLSAGCNSAAQIPGTPRGTYTVTITGTSGMTTNTVQVKLVVK